MKNIVKKLIIITITTMTITGCIIEKNEENKDYTRDDYFYTEDNLNIINNFYNEELSINGEKINELPTNYNIEEAIQDKCYARDINGTYNYDIFEEFIKKYNNKESAHLRMIKYTTEGNPIIYDIKYDVENDKIVILYDNTRDFYGTKEIEIYSYERIDEYNNSYWVACNGELTKETVNSSNCFVIGDKN